MSQLFGDDVQSLQTSAATAAETRRAKVVRRVLVETIVLVISVACERTGVLGCGVKVCMCCVKRAAGSQVRRQ